MKRIFTICLAVCCAFGGFAQNDTTGAEKPDTIKVGGMIIIRQKGKHTDGNSELTITNRRNKKLDNISTNWFILDLGFSNYNDQTNYSSAEAQAVAPGFEKNDLKLRTWKSRNVNLWIFMQRLNMIEHVVNLKYGAGLEMNNYFYDPNILFQKNPTMITTVSDEYKKVKLAVDYLTVPVMINFDFNPNKKKSFGFSAGVSAGYRYSTRFKTKGNGDKKKIHDDFELKDWKLSYVGEILLGPVKLYGSYAMNNMWDKGLDQTPYNVGIRFSNW